MKKRLLAALLSCFGLAGCFCEAEHCTLPEGAVLLDVRSQEEYAAGHLENAICIPHDEISDRISAVVPEKGTPLYIYCRSGRRVKIAMEALRKLGYNSLHDLGGIDEAGRILDLAAVK